MALKSDRFLAEIKKYFETERGTFLHDVCVSDHLKKISGDSSGYAPWLSKLLGYAAKQFNLTGRNVLDIGCGAGELTVWMNTLGYYASGIDMHKKFISLAKILAAENGLPENTFVPVNGARIPFPDKSFDIVTLFSVIEHVSDEVLKNELIPELLRVCRGVICVNVPNRLKPADDHTGLWFVPWMPRRLAEIYIKSRGKKYRYYISESGGWDVYYRSWKRINAIFSDNFEIKMLPEEVSFPPIDKTQILSFIGRRFSIGKFRFSVGIPVPLKLICRLANLPLEAFYMHLNFVLAPKK